MNKRTKSRIRNYILAGLAWICLIVFVSCAFLMNTENDELFFGAFKAAVFPGIYLSLFVTANAVEIREEGTKDEQTAEETEQIRKRTDKSVRVSVEELARERNGLHIVYDCKQAVGKNKSYMDAIKKSR